MEGTGLLSALNGALYAKFAMPFGEVLLCARGDLLVRLVFDRERGEAEYVRTHCRAGMSGPLRAGIRFLREYMRGAPGAMPPLDLSPYSTSEQRVYAALMKVPFGATVTYGELALLAGFPRGARFAGNAMAKNRLPVLVPCHRVLHAGGGVGNYTSGADIKAFLLEHEGSLRRI